MNRTSCLEKTVGSERVDVECSVEIVEPEVFEYMWRNSDMIQWPACIYLGLQSVRKITW